MRIFNEETLDKAIDDASDKVGVADLDDRGEVEIALDRALRAAKTAQRNGDVSYYNVLLVGEAGAGKTTIVNKWAQKHGINLVTLLTSTLDDPDLSGAIAPDKETGETARRLSTTELDNLDKPNSVLFLDEFNRGKISVRNTLLTLISEHKIQDVRVPSRQRKFNNMLFTVAAQNPDEYPGTADPLDPAEEARFATIYVPSNKRGALGALNAKFGRQLETCTDPEERKEIIGRIMIANELLTNKDFEFDSSEDIAAAMKNRQKKILSGRTLEAALMGSDGTVKDFLDIWNQICSVAKKPMAQQILRNFKSTPDKANDLLNKLYGIQAPVEKPKRTRASKAEVVKPSSDADLLDDL